MQRIMSKNMLAPKPSPRTGSEVPPVEPEEPGGVRLLTGPTGQVFRPVGQVLKEFQAAGAGVRSPPRVVESALLSEGAECDGTPVEIPLQPPNQVLTVEGTERMGTLVETQKFLDPILGTLVQIRGPRAKV